ncbi:MAG: HAD hydrolase family protein [Gammaproteobacteria bacterium]|nr:HAD hydrolase family protein [Gammaproteobacteria bacterium]
MDKAGQVGEQILAEVPGSAVAADQHFRDTDLAIDFCEDVAPLADRDVQRIQAIFQEAGAVAKISSIHVNGWFGDHDKLTMTQRFCREILKVELGDILEEAIFIGDSPNDAPMFAHFKHSFGVANVRDFAAMDAYPAWLSKGRGGDGFVEIAHSLLAARGGL